MEGDYKELIEAVLFMSPRALSLGEISEATGIASLGALQTAINEVIEEYRSRKTALEIIGIDNKFMFSLKEPFASRVSRLAEGPDLSRGALRVLAYVSKNDGIMQSSIVKIFGAGAYDYVKELADKEFIEAKKEGRSKKITTTAKFREYFNQATV